MTSYREKLQDARWLKRKTEIVIRDDYKCQFLHSHKGPFSVHHKYYEFGKDPWDYPDEALITVCQKCHDKLNDRSENSYQCKCYKWKRPVFTKIKTINRLIRVVKNSEDQKTRKIYFSVIEECTTKILDIFNGLK